MQKEVIAEIDWNDNVIAVHPKEKLKEKMFPHRVSLVIPKTRAGKLILCRRAKDKHPFPDTWCCAIGGKVLAGESYEEAALRETKEEVGRSLAVEQVTTFSYNKDDYKAMFAVFTAQMETGGLVLDPSEIQYLQAFTLDEINQLIKSNSQKFAPTFLAALDAFTNALK